MWIGIGNTLFRCGPVNVWHKSWVPPSKSSILAGGNGTIILIEGSYYLRGLNDRNFLITGYDFDSTWLSGDFVFSGGKPVYSNGKQVIK